MEFIQKIDAYLKRLQETINQLDQQAVEQVLNILVDAYQTGKRVIIFGNGGSASTASHIACDFNKGVSLGKSKRFKVISLCDNIATIMAYSNDLSYEDIFVEQLKNFLEPQDVVIGISGSGNSKNVLKAIAYANQHGAITIGFTGYNGGKLKAICHHSLNANVNDMQISEDIHMILNHVMMQILEEELQ
jgi:D-sedoheptulose 7-phosphate isomerase